MESNITAKSAIECLKKHKEEHRNDFIVLMGAVATAIEALKKQIPKKPFERDLFELGTATGHCCPKCNNDFSIGIYKRYKYCPDCGQALDWSNE